MLEKRCARCESLEKKLCTDHERNCKVTTQRSRTKTRLSYLKAIITSKTIRNTQLDLDIENGKIDLIARYRKMVLTSLVCDAFISTILSIPCNNQ